MADEKTEKAKKKLMQMAEMKISQESKLNFYYGTAHLPHFNELLEVSALEGIEYIPIIKGCYYHILSKVATSQIIKVKVGALKTDLRMHLTIPLSSGQGKKNIKNAIHNILKELKYKGHSPTSSHPEQLIGKVINRGTPKKPIWIKNKGYLSRDYVILDEAYNILMSRDNQIQETRKNFRIAKDPIGENLVEKKSVENTFDEEERLEYYPRCITAQFLQPKILPSNIVEEGDFRRDLVLYVKGIANRDKTIDYKNRLKKIDNSSEALDNFVKFAENLKGRLMGNKIEFEESAVDKLIELHSLLVKQGFFHSEKGFNFSEMIDWTLQDLLVKISSLIGIAHRVYNITSEIVELAFMDLLEFFSMQLDFINEKVRGKLDYGEGWQGAQDTDQECLEWLYNKGQGKEVLLADFRKKISEIKECGEDQAQKYYQGYEKKGWIEISHEFQKYYVKMAFIPKYMGSKLNLHAGNVGNVGNEYNRVFSRIESIIKGLPSFSA